MPPYSQALAVGPSAAREPNQREMVVNVLALMMPTAEAAAAAGRLMLRYGSLTAVLEAPLEALRDGGFGLPVPVAEALAKAKSTMAVVAGVAAARARDALDATAQRRSAGEWLRSLRHAAGLSQRAMAVRAGCRCYTVIDRIESGAGRVSWRDVPAWAAALRVRPADLARGLLRAYEPDLHGLLTDCHVSAAQPSISESV